MVSPLIPFSIDARYDSRNALDFVAALFFTVGSNNGHDLLIGHPLVDLIIFVFVHDTRAVAAGNKLGCNR